MAKKKKKKVPMIAQATPKHGIAYRKLPYSKTRGTAYHWRYVIRATGKARRKLIAKGIENAVECHKVKYSNEGRTNAKLYDDTKPYKFNCLKLKKKSSTNCCNLASVACRYAGIHTPRKSSARTLPQRWAKVKGLKAKTAKKKITVSWKSLGKGYKYEVYTSLKMNKGFKKTAASGNKVTVKKLKKGKKYYVKVRAYKTVGGKKVYTTYSDLVLSGKVK